MKYKVGDKVLIKDIDWYNKNKDVYGIIILSTKSGDYSFTKEDTRFCGRVVTIAYEGEGHYLIAEDDRGYFWTDEMIERLVEEAKPNIIEEAKTYWDSIKDAWVCPDGYIFKDENGNVINATKIVLEEKKKDVDLTQERINTIVHESCVSFCKHCGCGVPRETCTSLGTCQEHDEYRTAIRTHLMEKKEKEYPKGLRECHDLLGGYDTPQFAERRILLGHYECLLTCRDAYWKIAGEEMGLGKPWEPDWRDGNQKKYCIYNDSGDIEKDDWYFSNPSSILAFPTEEMRDAFYENFMELIESVKELL